MDSGSGSPRNYGRLKELLDSEEEFPLLFSFKIIGINSEAFRNGVESYQRENPKLKRLTTRESAGGKHLSITYEILADSSSEIIWAYEQAATIEDLRILL